MTSRIKLNNIKHCIEIENLLFDNVKRLSLTQTKSQDIFKDLGVDKI